MRAFLAIELPDAVREAIESLIQRLRQSHARVRWVKSQNMHLTIRFLGEIEPSGVDGLASCMQQACDTIEPFTLAIKGTGAFPNLRRPAVIWVGAECGQPGLIQCRHAADAAASAIGVSPEKQAFKPHLTLARIPDPREGSRLFDAINAEHAFQGGAFQVDAVALFSSRLLPGGPVYQREHVFPLRRA